MRENRTSGSEGGGTGNLTGPSYPIVNKTPETSPEDTISLCLLDTRARKVVW